MQEGNKQSQSKPQLTRKISDGVKSFLGMKQDKNKEPPQPQSQSELQQKEIPDPPIMDLLNFEYLYSTLKSISEGSVKKCIDCIKVMTHEPIEHAKLANVIYMGVDDEMKPVRAITWRILIGYLPLSRKQWITILEKNTINYSNLIDENILTKIKKQHAKQTNDHPLSRSKESLWNTYFEDHQLWTKIEQDTKRTRQKDGFFGQLNTLKQDYESGMIPILSKNRTDMQNEYNYDVLTRILFIYAKLHQGFYVQGMNEIVALIYYCFANDQSTFLRQQAEVDTFYCFSILMSEFKENFSRSVSTGVEHNEYLRERIRMFSELMKKADAKLFEHFQKIHLDFKFFCIKWFIASLAQELIIGDTLKLWDSIICQTNKNEFVHYLSLSIILQMREDLLKSDFGEAMMRIQNLEHQNLDMLKVINNAYLLQKEFRK